MLCDVHLPGESGLDLIKYVISAYPNTAIIVVSGADSPENITTGKPAADCVKTLILGNCPA
jgi:DNA-binding NarL/FixJ family response regulator